MIRLFTMKNKFAERIKELRVEKGLSQRQLSKLIGFSQAAIANWESNLQTPSIDVALKFALFFKVSTDYLIGLED